MNIDRVEKIANAVLYEGYLLYPYRASAVKNRQRFNFGVLYPHEYCELNSSFDNWEMQTECLVSGDAATLIETKVRFLQMGVIDDRQEGLEREVSTPACSLESILAVPLEHHFVFADADGLIVQPVEGELGLGASMCGEDLFKITLRIRNLSSLEGVGREDALLRALVSVHSILHVAGGSFISATDPPARCKTAAKECANVGTWPVLAGDEGQTDLMLSSPIILPDYPQIAPESPGDLCDGTEIDEILALRILTMTEGEKFEVRNGDDRARKILERTELMPPEHFQKLHGALRGLRARSEESR